MPAPRNNITDTVGDPKNGAANRDEDVKVVQGLLNVQLIKDHCGAGLLPITGSADSGMLTAILEFQRRRGLPQDGLIHPCGPGHPEFDALRTFSGPRSMRASRSMIDSLKQTEHFGPRLYDNDGADNTTIGYGHLVHLGPVNGSEPKEFKHGITQARADDLFRGDLSIVEKAVNHLVGVPLTQSQFDALVSLAFNVGAGRGGLETSTLLEMLNGGSGQHTGDYLGAAEQFGRWKYVHHAPSEALARRREAERIRFLQR